MFIKKLDGALALQKSYNLGNRILGWYADYQVHMVHLYIASQYRDLLPFA